MDFFVCWRGLKINAREVQLGMIYAGDKGAMAGKGAQENPPAKEGHRHLQHPGHCAESASSSI